MSIRNILVKVVTLMPFGVRDKIRHIPGLKQLQSMLLKKWVNNSEFESIISGGPAKGLKFPVTMPQDKLMWIGTFELEFATALQQYVKAGWICYDIGGYKGYYAGIMALKGAGKVFVFEPMPANAEKIQKMILLNNELPITLKQFAVSDSTGKATFKLMPEETMGKLEHSSFQPGDKEIRQITVECISLDEVANYKIPEPDFIKIDVEGAEEFVLKGGLGLLKRKKPFLMIEVHSPEIGKRCLSMLVDCYSNIRVLETGQHPAKGTPEISHYIAYN